MTGNSRTEGNADNSLSDSHSISCYRRWTAVSK